MMTLHNNINSIKMKTVGAVVFIFLLLLIAGVEPNPGPADVLLVFRLEYLLMEVALKLLRIVFDIKVNNDLMQYLKTNPQLANKLNDLINKKTITEDQKKYLPPLDKSPNTANFDITLLVCLLRNICGLKTHRDPVWHQPANGDLSVEADITRVKECRNYVVHKSTVYISESDFNLKWNELCQILHRLNNLCVVPNLTEMIKEAKIIPLDDQLKQKYDIILKASHEAEEQANNSKKCIKSYTYDDIRERLQQSYETGFRTLCVTPLYSEDDRMDMVTIYTQPEMKHVPYHRARQSEGNYEISSYEQVFCETNTAFRNIFVTGDAGMGKTSFGQFMSLLWSKARASDIVGNERVRKDANFIKKKFDFVFHVSLKETIREDVVSMIIDKYFNTSSKDEFEETTKTIEQILRTQNCLVILDGLDEWRPDMGGNTNNSLPRKVSDDSSTYLTTCRPYRIETVRLEEKYIDHQVQITGFDHEKYIRKVIDYINKSEKKNKNPEDFLRQISIMGDQSKNPLITSQLIVVWFKGGQDGLRKMSKAMIYGNIVEMLFERAEIKNQITFPLLTPTDVQLPKSFSGFPYLQKYVSKLEKVCYLSFLLLFDQKNEALNLVFTKKQLMSEPYNICPEEIEFLCQLGIISKNKVIASFGEQEHMLSFLHQSFLEFLAAMFVSFFDKTKLFPERVKEISISDIIKYHNFLALLSGISSQMPRLFFEIIYTVRKDEIIMLRKEHFAACFVHKISSLLETIQDLVLICCKEISMSDNSQFFMNLEDFYFQHMHAIFEDHENLKTLLGMNCMNLECNVKSLSTDHYLDECSKIKGLQYLLLYGGNGDAYDDKFTDLMLQNKSTLHYISFENIKLTSKFPVRSLTDLTSICFSDMYINHTILHDLINYISIKIQLENIYLRKVKCNNHTKCKLTLNLSQHSKLRCLHVGDIDLVCNGINTSSLSSLIIGAFAQNLSGMYLPSLPVSIDAANIIKNSKLKHLCLSGCTFSQSVVTHVINTIRSLLFIEDLTLERFTIDDASLQLHPHIECNQSVSVVLYEVNMSEKCFHDFIDSIRNNQSMVRVRMFGCYVPYNSTSHPPSESTVTSLRYMLQHIENIPSLRITMIKGNRPKPLLGFETIK